MGGVADGERRIVSELRIEREAIEGESRAEKREGERARWREGRWLDK